MNNLVRTILAPTIFLAVLLFSSPIQLVAASPTISIMDVRNLDPNTFQFPGRGAFNFKPGIVIVSQGGMVTFTNKGYDFHTVTSYTDKVMVDFEGVTVAMPVQDRKFNSTIPIAAGETFNLDTSSLTPGDYKYFCLIHPWMQAILRVVADSSITSAHVNIDHGFGTTDQFFAGSASWGFFPRNLRAPQGSKITVNNNGHIFHTFTSYTRTITFVEGGHTLVIPLGDVELGLPGWDSEEIQPGGGSFMLDTGALGLAKGTYTFFCEFHPWMLGSLTLV